ncbi:MAG: hypothetical protein EPO12_17140 [Aquabacterium sp.]|nr:MAG: hypothetical protein EPO12_17140 [Aquabacterium sp.]
MERLMVLRLELAACAAEVSLNGIPAMRLDASKEAGPLMLCLPVHEYTVAGPNQLGIVIDPPPLFGAAPPPAPQIGDGRAWLKLRLLLPRMGHPAVDTSARTLAQHDWAAADGEAYETPLAVQQEVAIPVNFPRWRWLDAPPLPEGPVLEKQALAFVQKLALDLARGDPESFLAAARLRFEELALAYQRTPADEVSRFRAHIQRLYADRALRIKPPAADAFRLRRIADGRLVECLDAAGQPALRSEGTDNAAALAWPLRLAAVEGKFYVLR